MAQYLDIEKIIEKKDQIRKIFFYRVCGTGMGAAACLLSEAGYEVHGGDKVFYPPMSDFLKETSITTHPLEKVNSSFLSQYDLVVVGNVVPRGSEDALIIEDSEASYCSFPAVLGALILNDRKVVGISGTHGKTTTTYFMSQLFKNSGHKPGHFIGGVIPGSRPGILGQSPWFFIESDEYDSSYFEKYSKFLSYQINDLITTSLEFDHADIYSNMEEIKDQFRLLLKKVPGRWIYQKGYPEMISLAKEFASLQQVPYGDDFIKIIETTKEKTVFEFYFNDQWKAWETNVFGKHNVENLTSCLLFALSEGLPEESLRAASMNLRMVKRRQEMRGRINNLTIIDDFAHHPRAVAETINSIKCAYPESKVIALFEPHSATSRSNIFQKEFIESLKIADEIFITTLARKTSVKGTDDLNPEAMVAELRSLNRSADLISSLDEVLNIVNRKFQNDTVLLVMSNGTVKGFWESDFVKNLS